MLEKFPKLIWGIVAFGIYFLFLSLLVYYFNIKERDKSKKFVKKNTKHIQVSLATSKEIKNKSKQNVSQEKQKNKQKIKKELPPESRKNKVIKEKIVKKKSPNIKPNKKKSFKKPKVKKANKTLDLFSDVKISENKIDINMSDKPIQSKLKTNLIKVADKPLSASERISSSLKVQKNMQIGEENEYFAKVQRMLEDWPAQSDFAGEKATVILYIKPTGRFEFKVKSGSNIDEFNEGLIAFLEQLQSIGFGEHSGEKTYEYEAEFIAKE